jgi:intermediate peptidase
MCKLVLLDASGQLVGTVYVDLFQRHKKIGQPAHLTLQCGCADTKGFIKTLIKEGRGSDYSQTQATSMPWQPPVVALLLSFPRSAHSADPCLSLQDVETLYHEFGHALHSLLSRTTFQHLSGTRGSVDFVEVLQLAHHGAPLN